MIIRSAAKLGCVKLFSEDLTDGEKYDGLAVHNPYSEL